MAQRDIEALATTGAAAIVAAMATGAWDAARDRAARLLDRAGVEAQLDANAALVAGSPDMERARLALVGLWQLELERFLAAHPHAAGDLSAMTAEIQAALPVAGPRSVQYVVASDHGVAFAVQHGTQHVHYTDTPRPQPPPAAARPEAD